jgi:hypothetical protein
MRCPPSWTSACEEIELAGGFCKVLVTPLNSAATPLLVIQKRQGLSAKPVARARMGAFLPWLGRFGPDSTQNCSSFSFLFFYQILENL